MQEENQRLCASVEQGGVDRLINLCEMSKPRKHTFLRLTIYRSALLQAKWPGLYIQLIPLASSI